MPLPTITNFIFFMQRILSRGSVGCIVSKHGASVHHAHGRKLVPCALFAGKRLASQVT
jgi:hypothetical protein